MEHAGTTGTGPFAIDIQGMSVRYGRPAGFRLRPAGFKLRTFAVRDLSIRVPRGAIYGLVGPSGAGKTTTMSVLATIRQPDSGDVRVDGIDIQTDPMAVRERIGYLPDFTGVYGDLTVREYLEFYAALFRIPSRLRRQSTDELLELIGLTDQWNRPVKFLSRGMMQQLGLARCLIHDPSVLLLDEPAAGMDPRSRLELRDILQELARFGKTILISFHMLSELAEVCTHLGFMHAGELIAEGETNELMSAMSPEAHLRVRLLNIRDRDAVRALLEANPACRQVETAPANRVQAPASRFQAPASQFQASEPELGAWFSGTGHDLAALLEQLCADGISVTEFALEDRPLEEVFLLMTGTRTQT